MRLDLFLKLSRLCPRRSLAQTLCDAGFVLLNGRPSKSAHLVKVGDEIVVRHRNNQTTARVMSVPAARSVSRADAKLLVEIVNETELAADDWGLSLSESNADLDQSSDSLNGSTRADGVRE
ncbi:MAG: S4 domain-containing protein [Pyrinomonadaceae bacterium]